MRKIREKEQAFIRENSEILSDHEMSEILHVSWQAIYAWRHSVGIRKSKGFVAMKAKENLSENFLRTSFKKGHSPANKGKHVEDYMRPENVEKWKSHQFKPGNVPACHKEIGHIVWRYDHGHGYYYVKATDLPGHHNFIALHKYLWEQQNGPIPPGHIVVFKDKNSKNCTIENLELLSRGENMLRNSVTRFPPELRKTIHLVNKAKKLIENERSNAE